MHDHFVILRKEPTFQNRTGLQHSNFTLNAAGVCLNGIDANACLKFRHKVTNHPNFPICGNGPYWSFPKKTRLKLDHALASTNPNSTRYPFNRASIRASSSASTASCASVAATSTVASVSPLSM